MFIYNDQRVIARSQEILNSFRRRLGRELIDRTGDPREDSQRLFEAHFVVVAHDATADPVLNYGNNQALLLWEMNWDAFCGTPSRLTAEPVHRDERARMLAITQRQGYIGDYSGVRVSSTGRRFLIKQAIVWNLEDEAGQNIGQAATFDEYSPI